MPNTKTVRVPHLGGIDAAYQMPYPYDASKPTLVLVNSMNTSSELYQSQFKNKQLTDVMNLIAIELLGHGQTRSKSENFTYWDTAIMNLHVLEALNIKKAFVLGTSQGGWVTARMALFAPDTIVGIIPVGTSMDSESERTRVLGCWDGVAAATGAINSWTTNDETPDFEPASEYVNFLIDTGMGKDCDQSARKWWVKEIKANYKGDDGRRRIRMAAINLRERDTLHGRLFDIRCPVLWLHVSLPGWHVTCLARIDTVLGHFRCRILRSQCRGGNQVVCQLPRCTSGCHSRGSTLPQLLPPQGSGWPSARVCWKVRKTVSATELLNGAVLVRCTHHKINSISRMGRTSHCQKISPLAPSLVAPPIMVVKVVTWSCSADAYASDPPAGS